MSLYAIDDAEITCGHEYTPPRAQRVGQIEYTPYGPPWDSGTDAQGQAQYRASSSTLTLHVGGQTSAQAAANAQAWSDMVMNCRRLVFRPTGRFLRVLLVRSAAPAEVVRGTLYKLSFELEYADPFWHAYEGDGSMRLTP